jgi:AbrB family looped-hinge helix DNA binding protein
MAHPDKSGKPPVSARVSLGANGRIVIPAAMREALGVKTGDSITLEVEDGVLRIESFRRRLAKIQDEIIQLVGPNRSLADELIDERREEARKEQEKWKRESGRPGVPIRRAG